MAKRNITFLINANVKNFTKGMDKATKRFKRFGMDMERVGQNMTRSITAPLAAIGGLAVKAAGDFESSFADIRKTVDATEAQFAQMSKEMRALAKTVPTSVNELNKMAGVAGQLGIGTENIVGFTKVIAMLGDTTDVAGEQAALSLSRFMNIMGTSEKDISRLGSAIVGLGNNFAAMESEIIDIATSMAPLGNSVGLTDQQVLAFAATIAASGGEVQAASTAFQKTANIMKQAVIEGNADLMVFAKTAGMSATAFQKAFQEDAAGALQSFLGGLKRVQEEGGSTAMVLDQIGLADQRLIREFGKVLGNLDDLDRALKLSNDEWRKNTALTNEASKRYSTFNSRLKILYNRIYDLGITIGDLLIPYVERIVTLVTNATTAFSNLSTESKMLGLQIAFVAAMAGPALIVMGKLTKAVALLISPAVLAKAALVGLFTATVVSGQWLIDNFDKIDQGFRNVMKSMEIAALTMARGVISAISSVIEFVVNRTPHGMMASLFGFDPGQAAVDFVGITGMIEGLTDTIESEKDNLKDGITTFNNTAWGSFSDSAKHALELAKNTIINGLQGIVDSSIIQGLLDKMNGLMQPSGGGGMSISGPTETRQESPISHTALPTSNRMQEIAQGWLVNVDGANKFKGALEEVSIFAGAAMDVAHSFTSSFGQGMANVIVQGEKLVDTLKNIGKLLASAVIQKAISIFLTGGLGGSGFFSAVGGGLFGSIFGVNDALITSGGDVVKFHPDDSILAMKDFSKLGVGGSQKVEVFGTIKGQDIFISSNRGGQSYGR